MLRVGRVVVLLAIGSAGMAQPMPQSFDDLDTDATGTLSPDEVGAMFARLRERGADDRAADPRRDVDPDPDVIFSRWDADGDGAVSREEFEARPRRGGPRDPDNDRERPRRPFVL